MAGTKLVKRYANRKLYDTERSCYVTLDDIALMVREGDDVRVVDNKSGQDLTTVTLAQIIFEAEKKNNFMPMGLLRGLIKDSTEQLKIFTQGSSQADGAGQNTAAAEPAINGNGNHGKDLPGLLAASRGAVSNLKGYLADKLGDAEQEDSQVASAGRDVENIQAQLAALTERLADFAG